MATITLKFPQPLNASVQIGDTAYYTNDSKGTVVVEMGSITAISGDTFTCKIGLATVRPILTSFILFTKDNKANLTSVLGYFANVQFRNDSQDYAELFAVGSEIVESSK